MHAAPRIASPVFHRAPTIIRPHTGLRAGLPFRRSGLIRGGRAFGTGTGLGVLGFDGAGLGLATLGDLPPGDIAASPPPPRVIAAEIPPPCVRPLVIAVGRGLRHVARTRVVYGAPSVCGP